MENRPKTSVAIPVHNGEPYLVTAIESVLSQDFADFELIICDNASRDSTPQICRSFNDARISYRRYDEFVSAAANWNRCIEAASGEYVVLLHADDVLLPSFLRRAVEVLDANPDIGLLHCSVQRIDRLGHALAVQRLHEQDAIDRSGETFERLLIAGCVINPAGVMVRRSVYETVGIFTSAVIWGIDWHMWMRASMRFPIAYLADVLAQYREHPHSGTARVFPSGRNNASDELWVVRDIVSQLDGSARSMQLHRRSMRQLGQRTWSFAEVLCRDGHTKAARANLRSAVRFSPHLLLTMRFWGLLLATLIGHQWFERMHHLIHAGAWRNQNS